MRLMIVEDNLHMRKMIRKIVAMPHDEVLECSDGDEAINIYNSFNPDLVLMDFEMPHVDGITATAKIIERNPLAKVFVVSQHDDVEVRDAAVKAGAKKFIPKQNILQIREFLIRE